MITDCFGARAWDFSDTEAVFLQRTFALLRIVIPAAIWLLTWKMCHTEQVHQPTSVLGLAEPSSLSSHEPWGFFLPACVVVTILTFLVGLLSVEVYRGLKEALLQLLA